jgi:hypothetical protein
VFRFRHLPTLNEADNTANWEQLQTLLSEGLLAENLAKEAVTKAKLSKATIESFLQLAVPANLHAAFGTAELKFVAAATAEVKPTHGLGVTPKFVFVSQEQQKTAVVWPEYEVPLSEANATEFKIFARNVKNEAATSQVVVFWLAIG